MTSVLSLLMVLVLPGASAPEVVRVRVPAKDVSRWFPPGTALRIMAPEDFESRVEAAVQRPAGRQGAARPALIRARHHARWRSGLLSGRTELVLGASPGGPTEFPLEPWTPAILPTAQSTQII